MWGSLSTKSVLELLSSFYREKASGCIELKRQGIEKALFLSQGNLFRAQSNQENEKLGQRFLKRNKISAADLETALTSSIDTKTRLGEILLRMSLIQESDLTSTIISQAREIALSVVDWEDGEFHLIQTSEYDKEPTFQELFTPEIIFTGMKRISNIALIVRLIGNLQALLKLAPDFPQYSQKMNFAVEERKLLDVLKKPTSLNDMVRIARLDKLSVYRLVASLVAVGALIADKQKPDTSMESGPIRVDSRTQQTSKIEFRKQRNLIGEILVQGNVISEQQLLDALAVQMGAKEKKPLLGSVIVQMGFATEEDMIRCLSETLKIEILHHIEPSSDVKTVVPLGVAQRLLVCPVRRIGSTLETAMLDPTNISALDDLSFTTGMRIQPMLATFSTIKEAWKNLYGYVEQKEVQVFRRGTDFSDPGVRRALVRRPQQKTSESQLKTAEHEEHHEEEHADELELQDIDKLVAEVVDELQIEASPDAGNERAVFEDAPVIKLVNKILRQAIMMKASDIHIEPWEKRLLVRYRLDGVLHEILSIPITVAAPLISRIKVISQMDIAEKRKPQEGRVKVRLGKTRVVDHRVSIVPSVYGESIVMRILDRSSLSLDMGKLGFDEKQLEQFQKAINEPYGMILCTGPTGSGKTTTLYSALHSVDCNSNKVLTVEDPVEYSFPGITQVQVNEPIGVTFPTVLRYFLRQDPDIILVGEVRDQETAEISAKAALTGHLVLSTVHTNDAPSAIGRLVDLGLKPYLVSASLLMVIAQRLVRKICDGCKKETEYERKMLQAIGFQDNDITTTRFYKGTGCQACGDSGLRGRIAIYEIMPVTKRIKEAILNDLSADQIKEIAVDEGMKDLKQSAFWMVKEGITTVEEALQNTLSDNN